MQLNSHHHLTYCTNIHPGRNWKETFQSLKEHIPSVRDRVAPGKKFGIGLRLSNAASEELAKGAHLAEFRNWLVDQNCYVFTMNGFPYGTFHGSKVKDKVHKPDWTTRKRLDYTSRLAQQLAFLISPGEEGGISTSPLSYRHWFTTENTEKAFKQAANNLVLLAGMLMEIEEAEEKYIHLDIEPEPDGLLENSSDFIHFYNTHLLPEGIRHFRDAYGIHPGIATTLIKRYITMCYDVCHFSLAFESPGETFTRLKEQGIRIGKVQISSALKADSRNASSSNLLAALKPFDEPTYLHQVTQKTGEGIRTYKDLSVVLREKPDFKELRAHFHVPIFRDTFGVLASTQEDIKTVLNQLNSIPDCKHLEVETYTWDVLPEDLKAPMTDSICRELEWVLEQI